MLRRIGFIAVLLVSLCAGFFPAATAQEATPGVGVGVDGLTVLAPDESYAGVTRGEWDARWLQWALSFPDEEVNPNFDPTGAQCGYGQSGPVFFLPAAFMPEPYDRTCVVPEGTALYRPVGGAWCMTVAPAPFFGRNEDELRSCATTQASPPPQVTIAIDGQEVADIETYRTSTPLFTLTFPEDNFLGVSPGVALAVSESAASLLIAPPPPGEYEIAVTVDFTDVGGKVLTSTTRVIVEAPQVIEPEASPGATPAT